MNPMKIAVVTTTRADYGLLYWLIHDLNDDPRFDLQLLVTGTHLSPEFGCTVSEIEKDGFPITERIEMPLSSDSGVGMAKSTGLVMIGFAEAFNRLRPDLVVVLGDRFELLAVCSAAVLLRIPIAHIHGGETTEGAMDEQIRHAVTKMAHLHFVAAEPYRQTVIQMGENPDHVYNFGAPGLEHLKRTPLLGREDLEKELNFKLEGPTVLVTYHPETVLGKPPTEAIQALLEALERTEVRAIFTFANADPGGRSINDAISAFAKGRDRYLVVPSLGQRRYLSLMKAVDALVGNSSSGLIEAPSLRKPAVNIGERQQGRLHAGSVIDCKPVTASIVAAIQEALSEEFLKTRCTGDNPYENGDFTKNILEVLKNVGAREGLLKKGFRKVPL